MRAAEGAMSLVTLAALFWICAVTVILIGLQQKLLGYGLLVAGGALAPFLPRKLVRDFGLLGISIGLLGLTAINPDTSPAHFLSMGGLLALVLVVPYLGSRTLRKGLTSSWHGWPWSRAQWVYLGLAILTAYLVLPYYFRSTGLYQLWPVSLDPAAVGRFFLGTNGLGTWDELFFVVTVFSLLRQHARFTVANAAQSVLFVTFLYELGFRSWGVIPIAILALSQGYIFEKTHSFPYILAIHLGIDAILFLVLIHLHYPQVLNIFIT